MFKTVESSFDEPISACVPLSPSEIPRAVQICSVGADIEFAVCASESSAAHALCTGAVKASIRLRTH
jgi:hypothetical protein